jgi:hypothetical protein
MGKADLVFVGVVALCRETIGEPHVGLRPVFLTFAVSVILAMVVFHSGHVGAIEADDSWQYYEMLVAYIRPCAWVHDAGVLRGVRRERRAGLTACTQV